MDGARPDESTDRPTLADQRAHGQIPCRRGPGQIERALARRSRRKSYRSRLDPGVTPATNATGVTSGRLLAAPPLRVTPAVIAAVSAVSNQRAIDVDVVEHRQSKVVRSSVLSFIENDRDALYRDGGTGLKRVAIEVRLQRSGGAAPAQPDEPVPGVLRCWRR